MLVQVCKRLAIFATIVALSLSAWGQAAGQPATGGQQKQWKDRAEFDLYDSITKAADPNKRIELLNTWKEKYPNTDFKIERLGLYLGAYQQLNKPQEIVQTSKEIIALDPKNIQALFFIAYLIPLMNQTTTNPPADQVDAAEKAANGILANVDATFAPDKKPATVTEENFTKERANVEGTAHATLGWVAQARKNPDAAEKELTKSLEVNPANGRASLWLGQAILAQKNPDKQGQALYQFARAAAYDGPGALTPPERQQLDNYLTGVYTKFHGDTSGLADMKQTAKTQVFPPAGFNVESAVALATKKEEEFKKSNPMLALWMSIKKELAGPNGAQYFESNMKEAALPPPDIKEFKGKLISAKPAVNPKELVLGIADANTPEVTLKLDNPMRGKAEPGIEIGFQGVAKSFSPDPFMVTFEVEKDKVTGWKAAPAPAPVKKGTGAKKAGARKKK